MPHELVTICFSHFCEKARWGLDRHRVPYREHGYMPMFHFPAVLRRSLFAGAGRADRASTRFSTPLLRLDDGRLITDSSDILAWVDEHHAGGALYPSDEVRAFDREASERLGPHTRRVVYHYLLPERALLHEMADANVSRRQARVFKLTEPLIGRAIADRLRVHQEGADRSLDKVRRFADAVAARASDDRPFLFGDRFTAADLSFASLMAPAVLPPEYGAMLPTVEQLPADAQAMVREMREHPAGQRALRLYRDHRRAVA